MRNDGQKTATWQDGGGLFRWWARLLQRPQRRAVRALEQRLRSKLVLDPGSGCQLWNGTETDRYGLLAIRAHRLAWELANGPIPAGLNVLHRCDNSHCCNPDHLFVGTQADNMDDMRRKGRARNGHSAKPKASRDRPLANAAPVRPQPPPV